VNLAFPLSREPRHDERLRSALEQCVEIVARRLPSESLAAVVLSGSFARGEGTVWPDGRRLRVLGDLEFYVVFERGGDARRWAAPLGAWAAEAARQVAAEGVTVVVEFGPITRAFLARRARPSIFVYDLREHGKVLWGDRRVLGALPRFGAEAIPPEDALFLLFNRLTEQLAAWDRLDEADADDLVDLAYQRAKLALDLAGSALAFVGRHSAAYGERPRAFARLVAETPTLQAALPPGFPDELRWAARVKSEPAEHLVAPAPGDVDACRARLRGELRAAVPAAAAVLGWELTQLRGARDAAPPLAELLAWYTTSRPLGQRIWDAAKLAATPGPAPVPLSIRRALPLLARATPRALLYHAAALAYLALDGERATDVDLGRLLPVRREAWPAEPAAQRRAIVALWTWCIRNR
jgi:predicted nucleotidyltransferase